MSNLWKGTDHEGGICWEHVTNLSIWGRFYHRIELVHFEEHSDIWFVLIFVKMSLMLHVRLVWRTGDHVILEKDYFSGYLIAKSFLNFKDFYYWNVFLCYHTLKYVLRKKKDVPRRINIRQKENSKKILVKELFFTVILDKII